MEVATNFESTIKRAEDLQVCEAFYNKLWEAFYGKKKPKYSEEAMQKLIKRVYQSVSSGEKKEGGILNKNSKKDAAQRNVEIETLTAEKETLKKQVGDLEAVLAAERNKQIEQCSAARKYAFMLLDDVQKRLDTRMEEDRYFEGLKKLLQPLQNLLGYARTIKELPEHVELSDHAAECYFTDGVLKELRRALRETISRFNAAETMDEGLAFYLPEQTLPGIVNPLPAPEELSLPDLIQKIYEKNGTNARARRTTDSRCILHTLFPLMMELAKMDEETAMSRLQEDALKIDFVLRSNGIFPLYIDSPELKEDQEGQRMFGADDVLKVAVPALFLKKSSEKNEYELLGDSYTGRYVSKEQV